MRIKVRNTFVATALVSSIGAIAIWLSAGTPRVLAQGRSGQFHLEKDCVAYAGGAGQYCTVVASNLPGIPIGSIIFYDQALGVGVSPYSHPYWLDSNIVIDASPSPLQTENKAVGRCTVDVGPVFTGTAHPLPFPLSGVCTLSDGAGQLAGLTARVNLSYLGGSDGALYAWDGTYSFTPVH